MWCVGRLDEAYIARMEDVLATYERPYDPQQPVVCIDEKPVTLHAHVRPALSAAPGREARFDSEYRRHGTANVFCAVEPKAGRHLTFVTPNRSGAEFAKALFDLALAYPEAETIHLVMDNLSTHSVKSLTQLCGEDFGGEIWDCYTPHYTPAHGSWLNQAEIEIGLFARQCLGKRRIPDLATLRREAGAWNRRVNRDRVKIDWKFDRKAARRTFRYKKTSYHAVRELDVDLRSNIAAEARAKIVYERLINFSADAGTIDTLQFLMTREITHMKAFSAALESLGKPAFSIGHLPPTPSLVDQYFNDSTGMGDRGEPDSKGPWNTGGDWEPVTAPAFREFVSVAEGTREPGTDDGHGAARKNNKRNGS